MTGADRVTTEDALVMQTTRKRLGSDDTVTLEFLMKGVTANWLAQAFQMDARTVRARLADCPTISRKKGGYTYNLATAAKFLVGGPADPEKYIRNMKPNELPAHLQDGYWAAALKRQKWEANAGDLWPTDKVLETLGRTFQLIKFTIQLWADTIDRQDALSARQRELIIELADTLQRDIYDALVADAAKHHTAPQLGELEGMVAGKDNDEDDGEEDYIAALV